MEKPIQLNDDELAAVAGGFFNFTNSLNNNLAIAFRNVTAPAFSRVRGSTGTAWHLDSIRPNVRSNERRPMTGDR